MFESSLRRGPLCTLRPFPGMSGGPVSVRQTASSSADLKRMKLNRQEAYRCPCLSMPLSNRGSRNPPSVILRSLQTRCLFCLKRTCFCSSSSPQPPFNLSLTPALGCKTNSFTSAALFMLSLSLLSVCQPSGMVRVHPQPLTRLLRARSHWTPGCESDVAPALRDHRTLKQSLQTTAA